MTFLAIVMSGCGSSPYLIAASEVSTPTPVPQGRTIVVTSTADNGPGSLRQALLEAQRGDNITFDPAVFPPSAPASIYLTRGLPAVTQGNLTIDASNAGVILDGSNIVTSPGILTNGISINSDGNTIRGLQIIYFSAAGIAVSGSASRNTIGPANIIAYNGERGIEVGNPYSLGNTITQNSIHDNGWIGIDLWEGGNMELPPPLIIDFDLAAGTVTGTACPNCTVEIFSDRGSEGEVYEGQTIGDSAGVFIFNKGAAFTGPCLTATATDGDGNTSEFSPPTPGTSRSVIFQEGNDLPKIQLQPRFSRELEDNRLGQMASLKADISTGQDVHYFVNQNTTLGLKRVRLSIDWFDWGEVDWSKEEYSKYSIDPNHDKAITGLVDNDIKITYTLVFWDVESSGKEEEEGYSRFKTEDEIQRYLDYAQFIVSHFKGKIEYYEILNEPITGSGTQQSVEVADYINLVKRVVPAIRQEDSETKIVIGAIGNLYWPDDYDYLLNILNSEVMPLVDGISFHPMHGVSPDYELKDDYYQYPYVVQEIKDVASSHGFKGEYFADELVWRTPQIFLESEPWLYSKIVAAKYYARGIIINLGLDLNTGLALESLEELPLMVKTIRNLCTVMAGTEPANLPIEIQCEATNIRRYSFSLPNGDKLIALWTDGVAVDDDPGVNATLILKGISAQKVMGIDVLNGFGQQLVTSTEDGDLVIQNLLVKDYPLILRFTDVTSS